MTTTSAAKKNDIQKLQRAIVDGLEDVKAQEIVVFDTEQLSALFERVIVASGTSNRQTKALASSVSDAVREAGFPKPRLEGEANGEWIIVDCGQAVVHVMQPSFRAYYNLEELWGEKPVRLKLGVAKPAPVAKAPLAPSAAKPATTLRRSNAAKIGVAEAFPSRAQAAKTAAANAAAAKRDAVKAASAKAASAKATPAKTAARKTAAGKTAAPASAPITKVVVSAPKVAAKKAAPAKKAVAKKAVATRAAPAKKAAAKKSASRV
jgi:ribosome-associated protein